MAEIQQADAVWIKQGIAERGGSELAQRVMQHNVASWLAWGALTVVDREHVSPLQAEYALFANDRCLTVNQAVLTHTERDMVVSAYGIDKLLGDTPIDAEKVRQEAGIVGKVPHRRRAHAVLGEILGAAEVGEFSVHDEEKMVFIEECAACAVRQGAAVGDVLAVNGVAKCMGISQKQTKEMMSSLALQDNALFKEITSTEGYTFFPLADIETLQTLANSTALPTGCERRRSKKAISTRSARQHRSLSLDNETTTRLNDKLPEAIRLGIVSLTRASTGRQSQPLLGGHRVVPGAKLAAEIEAVQQAVLYAYGFDEHVYGKRLEYEALREKLGLLPRDSLLAVVRLTVQRMQKPGH